MEYLKKILCFLSLSAVLLYSAQTSQVSLETPRRVVAANEQMITVLAEIENRTALKQEYRLSIAADTYIRILSNDIAVMLEPNEKLFVPLKAYIAKKQPAGDSELVFLLTGENGTIALSRTALSIPLRRSLQIKANESQVLMERVGDTLSISAQVYNGGNEPEALEVYATFPQGFGSDNTLRKKISVEAFSDTEIIFKKVVNRELLNAELFAVNIAGLDRNKDYFGNTIVIVQNALGNRRYVDPLNINPQYRNHSNHITWRSSNPFSPYSGSQNINLLTQFGLGQTRATVNLNGTYWNDANTDLLLQNSWLKIEHRNLGLQLGTLNSADLDISLIGRGAEMSYATGNTYRKYFRIGAVEKNYNLLDSFNFNNFPRGYSVFAKLVINLDAERLLENELITDTDPFQQGFIVKNAYEYNNRKNTFYRLDLGLGLARAIGDSSASESSVALGLNYRKNFGRYSFASNNYHSGGYYPGIRKGNTLFEQRVTKYLDTYSVYAAYSLNRFEPKNINPLYQYNSTALRNKAEVGGTFNVHKNLRLNATLQYTTDNTHVYAGDVVGTQELTFRSAVAGLYMYYSTPGGKHKLDLSILTGRSLYADLLSADCIYKLQASWYYRKLMISSSYQNGNFMLYEGNINGKIVQNTEKFTTMASYQIHSQDSKFNVSTNLFATYDRNWGNSVSLSLNADWQVFRTAKLFASLNYNRFGSAGFTASPLYYHLGITQDLPGTREEGTPYKNGNIRIFAFYDLDNNGIYNPETDRPAVGTKIKIRNTLFIAEADGGIKYRKVPYGDYVIKAADPDWYTADQSVTLDRRDIFLNVALQKTGIVKGMIRYQQPTRLQYEVKEQLAGLPVVFTGERGEVFTFYTDPTGNYSAYLPLGKYKLRLDSQALQKNVYVDEDDLQVEVVADQVRTVPGLLIKIRGKKVEVKKFGL